MMNENLLELGSVFEFSNTTKIPESIDWRQYGYINKVEDQGDCASCWSFVVRFFFKNSEIF